MSLFFQESLRKFDGTLKVLISRSLRTPKIVLTLTALIFLLGLLFIPHLQQSVMIEEQLDITLDSYKHYKRMRDLFGDKDSLTAIFQPQTSHFLAEDLCKIHLLSNQILFDSTKSLQLSSPFRLRQADYDEKTLSYPLYLPDPCTVKGDYTFYALLETPWNKQLFSKTHQDFLISFEIAPLPVEQTYGRFDAGTARWIMEQVNQQSPLPHYWTGVVAQQIYTLKGLAHSQVTNLIIMLLILIGLRIFLGTWKAGILYIGSLVITSTLVYGGMAFFGHKTDPLSICLFVIIGVASLEDFIFLSYYRLQRQRHGLHGFKQMATACFFTSLTTILGFTSLLISPLSAIQRFGGWAAFGAFVEWVLVFYIVPSFIKVFPSWQQWVNPEKSYLTHLSLKWVRWTPPRKLILLSLIVFIYPFINFNEYHLAQTPTEIFPAAHPFQQGIEYLKASRGWTAESSVIFEKNVSQTEQIEILKKIQNLPLIAKIETYSDIESFFTQNIHRADLSELALRNLNSTSLADSYKAPSGETRARLFLTTTNTESMNQLRTHIEQLCPQKQCWVSGEYIAFADYSTQLISTLFESLFMSLILVSLILIYLVLAQKSKDLIPILISSFWGPAVLLCLIKFSHTNINMVTCIIAGLLVGLTGDNAIQYLFANSKNLQKGAEERGIGSLQCSLLMALGSLVFLGSYFEPPKTLGVLLAVGFVLSLFGDLWVLKGLLRKDTQTRALQ